MSDIALDSFTSDCRRKTLEVKTQTPIDPDAQRDVTVFATTDSPDRDNEVVMPDGADIAHFEKNPVLLLAHSMGQGGGYALPIGKVVGLTRRPRGLLAGLVFSRSTEMGKEVKALFDEGMLNAVSIGFRSLEMSPMTYDEAQSRPDWKKAYERAKGRINVHRRWQLLEVSAVAVPSNPDALVTRYKSRGVTPPAWLSLPTPEASMDETTKCMAPPAVGSHVRHVKSGACGEVKSMADDAAEVDTHDDKCAPTGKMASYPVKELAAIDDDEAGEKAAKPREGSAAEEASETPAEEAAEDMPDGDEGEAGPLKRGVHVHVKAPHYKGVGVVQGVYKRGHVPNVPQDIMGTPDEPAARVKCYKAMGGGYSPTEDQIGAKCAHLTAMDEEMQPPAKKAAPAPVHARTGAPLPPLVELTEQEVLEGEIHKMAAELDRRMGLV